MAFYNNILIIGLGRIGKHILRILLNSDYVEKIYVNDLNKNIENHIYLLNYDNTYGFRSKRFTKLKKNIIFDNLNKKEIVFCNLNKKIIKECKFAIDSSGSKKVIDKISKFEIKTFVTNSSSYKIDKHLISNFSRKISSKDHIFSTSICDATAIYPIIKHIDDNKSISNGHVTTIHPWLSYQNLLDGNMESMQLPNHYVKDFELGRKSTETLIPKSTSVLDAISKFDKKIVKNLTSFSLRSPHPIVSSAIINLNLRKTFKNEEDLIMFFKEAKNLNITFSEPHNVSSDYIESHYACIIQKDQIKISNNSISLMLWYDNEFGYSYQVCEMIKGILKL